jgi:hypothetical protein
MKLWADTLFGDSCANTDGAFQNLDARPPAAPATSATARKAATSVRFIFNAPILLLDAASGRKSHPNSSIAGL